MKIINGNNMKTLKLPAKVYIIQHINFPSINYSRKLIFLGQQCSSLKGV